MGVAFFSGVAASMMVPSVGGLTMAVSAFSVGMHSRLPISTHTWASGRSGVEFSRQNNGFSSLGIRARCKALAAHARHGANRR